MLVDVGIVRDVISPDDLYTMEFLEKVYGR